MDEITIELKNGNKLTVELYNYDGEHPEICVFLKNTKEEIIQDVCMVREQEADGNKIECLVWADEMNEDYTHKFTIKQYDWNEESEEAL